MTDFFNKSLTRRFAWEAKAVLALLGGGMEGIPAAAAVSVDGDIDGYLGWARLARGKVRRS
jgi:hypothetical protein